MISTLSRNRPGFLQTKIFSGSICLILELHVHKAYKSISAFQKKKNVSFEQINSTVTAKPLPSSTTETTNSDSDSTTQTTSTVLDGSTSETIFPVKPTSSSTLSSNTSTALPQYKNRRNPPLKRPALNRLRNPGHHHSIGHSNDFGML